ncbi:DUF6735 family protein [Halosimplex sp. J119]
MRHRRRRNVGVTGTLRTVEWYEDEPVSDDHAQSELRGLEDTDSDILDCGVFFHDEGIEDLLWEIDEWVTYTGECIARGSHIVE